MVCRKNAVLQGIVAFIFCFHSGGVFSGEEETQRKATGYSYVRADQSAAIASVHPLATEAGKKVLDQGGNAIDAALAVTFALGIVDSHNSGIGGGCFILARLADGRILAIDGREMAPKTAHRDMYLPGGIFNAELSKTGALAAGIPGSVAALYDLQRQGGKLDFAKVIEVSIPYAEDGFPISDLLAARIKRSQQKLKRFPETAKIFLQDGQAPTAGQMLVQKDLAKTYKKLAKRGPDYFYRGEFAKKTAKWMKKNGGLLTTRDFKNYVVKYRQPVVSTFYGYDIVGFPPPSSGGVHVAQILSMLELMQIKNKTEDERYHLLIESSKLAFADRAHWLGDSDFVKVPKGLTEASYLKGRVEHIRPDKAMTVSGHGSPKDYEKFIFDKHTTHIATADSEGNWVAITTSLNTSFGSKVTIPGTGVLMNNQMDDFSAQPGVANAFGLVSAEANAIAPQKRPLSSMSPALVMQKGQPLMTVGAAGGPTIISQVSQTILNYLLFEDSLEPAMKRVRVHQQWKPEATFIDGFAKPELKASLEARGHQLKTWPRFGGTQAIVIKDGKFQAQSEPRIQ